MWSVDQVKSYCINLDRRQDRWQEVLSQPIAKKIPNLQRFSAVEGKNIDLENDPRISTLCRYNIKNKTRRGHEMIDTIGAVGCSLSHIALWKKLVESNDNVFLIIEDDFLATEQDWETVRQIFANYPRLADSSQWDIWTIGALKCYEEIGVRPADKKVVEDRWIHCTQFVGTQAYFISRTGAEKLLTDVYPIQTHIDWYITYYAQTKPFKVIHNKLVNFRQRGADSDINLRTCAICDIPTNVEQTHYVIPMDVVNSTVLSVFSITLVLWIAFKVSR